MNEYDSKLVLQRVEELKKLFDLGQRVIPFIADVIMFTMQIKPLIDELNSTFNENLKKMPQASNQLSRVTQANEMATTEIMDVIDGLFFKTDKIESEIISIKEKVISKDLLLKKINDFLFVRNYNEFLDEIILNEMKEFQNEMNKNENKQFDNIISYLNSIRNDSNSIMLSLQVQDITSQQVSAVNNLLETITNMLSGFLDKFKIYSISKDLQNDNKDVNNSNHETSNNDLTYDPNAIDAYSINNNRQEMVDSIINNDNNEDRKFDIDNNKIPEIFIDIQEKLITNDLTLMEQQNISQNDIDALFSNE